MATAPVHSKRRIAKPLGVSVLTAFDGVFIGLLPLALLIFLNSDPKMEISTLDYYLSAGLRIIVIAAALGAFVGENVARYVLLWSVTAVSILMIINTIDFLSSTHTEGSSGVGMVGNITRGLFWIGINWWYLNRRGVVDYYKQDKGPQQ